jgi:predicted phosphodiesterase
LNPDKLFFVPGNHDFDRNKIELLPSKILDPFQSENDVNEWLTNEDKRNELLKPFKAYKEFVSQYNNQNQPEYASVQVLEINNEKVGLLGINSALMTARNKDCNGRIADQGFLVVGEPQIYTSLQSIKDCEIKIAVLHHPFDWLTEFDRRRIKRPLGESCHFILCGHEHQSRVERVTGTDGDYVFIPAGASYDRPDYPNSYNFVHLNFEKGEGIVYLRKWSRDRTRWIKNEDACGDGQFKIDSLPKNLSAPK